MIILEHIRMSLLLAEIIFNNTPTRNSRDLTEYLKRNIKYAILKGNVKFRFKVAKAVDLAKLQNSGIKRLPVMFLDKKQFIGVPAIVDELARRVKFNKQPAPMKSENEILNEYFQSELGDVKKGSDGRIDVNQLEQESNESFDPTASFHKENERRRKLEQGGPRQNPLDPTPRQPPPKPSREPIQDDDYENRSMNQRPQQRPNYIPRQDNVDPGDPLSAFNAVRQKEGNSKDDDLVQMMMEKMGGSD